MDDVTLMAQISELKRKIDYAYHRIELLTQIADPDRHPFTHVILEREITRDQKEKLYDLMNKAQDSIAKGNAIPHHDFEKRVYEIVPKEAGDYHFAEEIVASLNVSGQYRTVYDHMKKDGMNLPTENS